MRHTLRTALAIAAVAGASFAAPAFADNQYQETWGGDVAQAQGPSLSRAEVLADLALYRRAGLDAFSSSEVDRLGNSAYERSLAEYQRLRSGPEYLAEVRRFGGEASTVAGRPAAPAAH